MMRYRKLDKACSNLYMTPILRKMMSSTEVCKGVRNDIPGFGIYCF